MAQRPGLAHGWIGGSLGAQLVLILTGVGVLGSIAITLLLAIVITPSFDRLEAETALAHRDRLAAMVAERGQAAGAIDLDRLSRAAGHRVTFAAGTAPQPALRRDGRRLVVAVPLAGADGRAGHLYLSLPRDLSTLGQRMLLLAVGGSTLLLLIVLAVLRRSITALVLQPLGRLQAHMQGVRDSGAMTPLAAPPREDEIGGVTRSFNAMLAQLAELRERVEAQSYRLGQSESAVAMIHNVRNALNPVSTILSQGSALAPPVERVLVDRALAELAGEPLPPARRRKLIAFVAAALAHEAAARAERQAQFEAGRDAMREALAIIGRQQVEAHERPHLAPCEVGELVAQNAAIARFAGAVPVTLDLPEGTGWAIANRVVLSQVIGNLLANAVEAIAAAGKGHGRIDTSVLCDGDSLTLTISDDGEGFAPGDSARLFQRGYSTRAAKSGGLGLHWCANAMNAMGGTLSIASDGPGRGARATLTLRAAEGEALAA